MEERQPEFKKNKKCLREPNEQPAQIHATGVNMAVNRKSASHADGWRWTLSLLFPHLIASVWHYRLILTPTTAQGFTLRLLHSTSSLLFVSWCRSWGFTAGRNFRFTFCCYLSQLSALLFLTRTSPVFSLQLHTIAELGLKRGKEAWGRQIKRINQRKFL